MSDPCSDADLELAPRIVRLPSPPLGLPPGEVVEVPLLLVGWQVSALEREARYRGLTAGEMLRHLLYDFIEGRVQPTGPDGRSAPPWTDTR